MVQSCMVWYLVRYFHTKKKKEKEKEKEKELKSICKTKHLNSSIGWIIAFPFYEMYWLIFWFFEIMKKKINNIFGFEILLDGCYNCSQYTTLAGSSFFFKIAIIAPDIVNLQRTICLLLTRVRYFCPVCTAPRIKATLYTLWS